MDSDLLHSRVNDWLKYDQWEVTHSEAEQLLKEKDWKTISVQFGKRISFGTAGLRGAMKSGWACMNDLVVIQASQGLAKYLEQVQGCSNFRVVIGYDARHNSARFAKRTAAAFLHIGAEVILFSVEHHSCAAGVMITASHNPKEDNGYKVYWSNGAQIIPPHDAGIAAKIEENIEPWPNAWDLQFEQGSPNCYCTLEEDDAPRDNIAFTYTAMHGVGWVFCQRAFEAFQLPPFFNVEEQVQPDPEFPTVTYPNPEEGEGALRLAVETADKNGSTVILANDPDADRLAVACKHKGFWQVLTGNQIGTLFAWWIFTNYVKQHPECNKDDLYMVASTVSSKMIKTIAQREGFNFDETLTGFKWIGNRTRELQSQGKHVLFSFEEAIGFCIGTTVVDKDGVCSSAVMAELCLFLATQGKTLVDCLDDLYRKYGYHCSYNSYYICKATSTIDVIFERIRHYPDGDQKAPSAKDVVAYPKTVGGEVVLSVRDVTLGTDSSYPDGKCRLPQQSGHMITFTLGNDCVLTLRTSGTEPKIKFYSEIKADGDPLTIEHNLRSFVCAAVTQLLQPTIHKLEPKAEE